MTRVSWLIALLLLAAGCHRGRHSVTGPGDSVTLRVDSTQFTVRSNGPLYEATIGFHFANHSGRTLSMNYCGSPPPPALEKQRVDGTWVHAYSGVILTCLILPPFRIPDGGSYDGVLKLAAGRPGTKFFPTFGPDSVPGIYRLRWELRAGPDPDNQSAPTISTVSWPFRLITP